MSMPSKMNPKRSSGPKSPVPKVISEPSQWYAVSDKLVAAVDIETLGFRPNAVVHEIGVVVTNMLPRPGTLWTLGHIPEILQTAKQDGRTFRYWRIQLDVLEQVFKGFVIDKDTVAFHDTLLTARYGQPTKILDELNNLTKNGQTISLEATRRLLDSIWKLDKIEEVWINHPAFDVPRICRVVYEDAVNPLPWNYKTEFDVATARMQKQDRAQVAGEDDITKFPKSGQMHDSIADCLWNLSIVSATTPCNDPAK